MIVDQKRMRVIAVVEKDEDGCAIVDVWMDLAWGWKTSEDELVAKKKRRRQQDTHLSIIERL